MISLDSSSAQEAFIREAVRTLGPGGRLILIECFRDGFERLNMIRSFCRMPQLPMAWYNTFPRQREVLDCLDRAGLKILEVRCFPLLSLVQKVLYEKLKRIRGTYRLMCKLFPATHRADIGISHLFPPLGYDAVCICELRGSAR
jgi:SAM-dependent methyltransferase